MKNLLATTEDTGSRLDSYLAKQLPELSRNQVQKMIRTGMVRLNDTIVKSATILKDGDKISYKLPEDKIETPLPERGDIDIVFENDDFMVVNKPAGLVVHPAHANTEHTLVNYLIKMRPEIISAIYDKTKQVSLERPGIVHRLDKDTSGLLLVAKNKTALIKLSRIIHNHKLDKTYSAIVFGWPKEKGEIKTFLRRGEKDRRKMEIHHELGKEAVTEYSVLKYYYFDSRKLALIQLKPITGRTHQLRVHLKSIGHPVIGDQTYSNKESDLLSNLLGVKRQLLNAQELKFRYNNNAFEFKGDRPKDFNDVLSKLKESDA